VVEGVEAAGAMPARDAGRRARLMDRVGAALLGQVRRIDAEHPHFGMSIESEGIAVSNSCDNAGDLRCRSYARRQKRKAARRRFGFGLSRAKVRHWLK
jgi:hypothetical protein